MIMTNLAKARQKISCRVYLRTLWSDPNGIGFDHVFTQPAVPAMFNDIEISVNVIARKR